MRKSHLTAVVVLLGAGVFGGGAARANGRFPGARQVAIAPRDPATLVLRTTFGQMLTRDGGQSFHWLCEEVIGYGGTQDPAIALTADGSLLNAAYEGTSVSPDGGCSFAYATGLEGRYSTDLTIDTSAPARALVIVAADPGSGAAAQCWETLDDGRQWAPRAGLPAGFFPQNVDIARSRPARVYVTGTQTTAGSSRASLLRSDDGGASWEQRDVPVLAGRNVYLSAVDPQDEQRLYVRVEDELDDELLQSTDGGESFTSRLKLPGGMPGFALSPDGSRIAVGGPAGGVLVAGRDDVEFAVRSATPVTCLAWGAVGLYACGVDEIASGFALGRSTDEGASFVPLLAALGDTCGPLTTCGSSSPYAQRCPGRWPPLRAQLRSSAVRPAACEPPPAAGGGPAQAAGGNAGGADVAGAGAAGSASDPTGPEVSGGGCRAGSPGAGVPGGLVVALGLGLLGRRRQSGARTAGGRGARRMRSVRLASGR